MPLMSGIPRRSRTHLQPPSTPRTITATNLKMDAVYFPSRPCYILPMQEMGMSSELNQGLGPRYVQYLRSPGWLGHVAGIDNTAAQHFCTANAADRAVVEVPACAQERRAGSGSTHRQMMGQQHFLGRANQIPHTVTAIQGARGRSDRKGAAS